MPADRSKEFYEEFLEMLRKGYQPDKIKGKSGHTGQATQGQSIRHTQY